MAITRATGFPINNQAFPPTSVAATWVTAGDLAVLMIASFSASGDTISAVSSAKTTGWTQVIDAPDATDNFSISLWVGTITSTGSDTMSVTWAGAAPGVNAFEVVVDELVSGLGSTNVWAVVTNGSIRGTGAATNVYPSLTSNTVTLQAYWGYQLWSVSATGGTGTGYTFTVTGTSNLVAFNGALATSTATQPSGSGTGGPTWAAAGIVSVALPASGTAAPKTPLGIRRAVTTIRRGFRWLSRSPNVTFPPVPAPTHPTIVSTDRLAHRRRGIVILSRGFIAPPTGNAPQPIVVTRPRRPARATVVQSFDHVFATPPAIPPSVQPQVHTRSFRQAGRIVTSRAPQPPQGARGVQPVVNYQAAGSRALQATRRGRLIQSRTFVTPPAQLGVQPASLFGFAVSRLFQLRHGPNAGRIILPQTPQPLPPVVVIASGRIPSLPFQGSQPTVASGRGG